MDVAETFEGFVSNLAISNRGEISGRYKRITKTLNKKYYESESETTHSLQVGSYGRGTAIDGISDLDMVFELPWDIFSRFNKYDGNGQSALLREIKDTIKGTYSRTDIKGDGQVVVVSFDNYVVEILPGFKNDDGSYKYPDSNDGGSWKTTKPRDEINKVDELNKESNGNLKNLCKMVRSWKNKVGAPMGGLLIDTLCYKFLEEKSDYKDRGFIYYDWYVRDFFEYLSSQNKDQEFWYAPGSNQKVYKKGSFIAKAKKAHKKCKEAIDKEKNKTVNDLWKEVFGRAFPAAEKSVEKASEARATFRNTEEYIDDQCNVDVQYSLLIDCEVSQHGFRTDILSSILDKGFGLRVNKSLRFYVVNCNVPEPFTLKWKVRNVGSEAERKDQIRGQITVDGGTKSRSEKTSFRGGHFVECYAIKNNICVARDRIDVPISTT
ncbi:MAG: SMODS domain-containing nucleotidyltransferase [Pseudomonadales bacterium]